MNVVEIETTDSIQCLLPKDAHPERRRLLQSQVAAFRPSVDADDHRVTLNFSDPAALPAVQEIVAFERVCCPTLDFEIEERTEGVRLTITGPKGTDAFVRAWIPELKPSGTRYAAVGAGISSMGGVVALLCCVLPGGTALAAAVSLPLVAFDGLAVALFGAGAVLGLVAWRSQTKSKACAQGC